MVNCSAKGGKILRNHWYKEPQGWYKSDAILNLYTIYLKYIKYQEKTIVTLMAIVLSKSIARCLYDKPIDKPYRKLEKIDYKQHLNEYELEKSKPLKPVQRLKNSVVKVPENLTCPKCSVPSSYLYANNGGKGQYLCKICDCLFNRKNRFLKEAIIKWPHC